MAYFDPGKYLVEISSQGFDESKDKKTPFFWLTFVPLGMINIEDPDGNLIPCNEYEREIRLWFTERATPYTIRRLRELGWLGSSLAELEPGGGHSFVGKTVRLSCSHRNDGDKIYDVWEFPPIGGGGNSENNSEVARKLDALFGGELVKTATAPAQSAGGQHAATASAPPDEELPF